MSKHYPPAYFRYRETHTTISISLSKEFRENLDKRRGELSYGAFVKKVLEVFQEEVSRNEDRVRENEDNFRVPCSYCGKFICFSDKDSNWLEVKKTLYEAFKEWGHSECLKKMEEKKAKKARRK
jgi:hypothetical protein